MNITRLAALLLLFSLFSLANSYAETITVMPKSIDNDVIALYEKTKIDFSKGEKELTDVEKSRLIKAINKHLKNNRMIL